MSIETRLARAGLPPLGRSAWLTIDLDALAHNLRTIGAAAGPGARIAAVVKADGYGHGLEAAGRALAAAGAAMLCVATVDEALALRSAGVDAPILCLYEPAPEAFAELAAAGTEIPVASDEGCRLLLERWSPATMPPASRIRVHLEVDTGMTRTGIPVGRIAAFAATLATAPGIELAGIWSHLSDPSDAATTAAQCRAFEAAEADLRAAGVPVPPRHVVNSGGILAGTAPPLELVRPGLSLYGLVPDDLPVAPAMRATADALRPAMTLTTRAVRIVEVERGTAVGYGGRWVADRRSRIATLPVGYGDGYARTTQPGAEVLVRGRRVPVVGVVSMDAVGVDVTDVAGVDEAEEFVLLGAQGAEHIGALELARRRNSISWEVLTGMARRIPRVYDAAAGISGVRTLAGEVLVREDPS